MLPGQRHGRADAGPAAVRNVDAEPGRPERTARLRGRPPDDQTGVPPAAAGRVRRPEQDQERLRVFGRERQPTQVGRAGVVDPGDDRRDAAASCGLLARPKRFGLARRVNEKDFRGPAPEPRQGGGRDLTPVDPDAPPVRSAALRQKEGRKQTPRSHERPLAAARPDVQHAAGNAQRRKQLSGRGPRVVAAGRTAHPLSEPPKNFMAPGFGGRRIVENRHVGTVRANTTRKP